MKGTYGLGQVREPPEGGSPLPLPEGRETLNNPPGRYAPMVPTSSFTPGPMVDDNDTFFR